MKDQAFLDYLDQLNASWPKISWRELGEPNQVAVLVIDLIRGFCDEGPLAGPRVQALAQPAAEFLTAARSRGIEKVYLGCDSHPPDSPEFAAFPPHCVAGTSEAELTPALAQLPFASSFIHIAKGSLCSFTGTDLEEQLRADSQLRTLIVIGDCTDLCIYHTATGARLLANHLGLPWRVVVVSSLVDTYDLSVETAREIGAVAHPGDFLQRVFLYHLHLNGIQVVSHIAD